MMRHPNRCHVCGSNYGHHRGCKLEDLSLKPEQESAIRSDPGNVSEFDVECLLHEIDYLRTELKESQWLTKNAVDELAALKELHANCETEISLRVLKEQHKECDERLLFAGDTCRELQYRVAELEADIAGLRQTIARQVLTIGQYQELRHKCPHPCDSCKEFERSAS